MFWGIPKHKQEIAFLTHETLVYAERKRSLCFQHHHLLIAQEDFKPLCALYNYTFTLLSPEGCSKALIKLTQPHMHRSSIANTSETFCLKRQSVALRASFYCLSREQQSQNIPAVCRFKPKDKMKDGKQSLYWYYMAEI